MKILRYVLMAALAFGMSGIAHAAGFSWNLQDPPGGGFFAVTQVGVPFSFAFQDCNFVVGGVTYTGCAEGQNQTGATLTSFAFTFPNTLGGLTPDCVSDSFAVITCTLSPDQTEYEISYVCDPSNVGCGVPPGGKNTFNLYENAVAGSAFPTVTGVAGAAPEPGSIWLALSGMGSLGYLVRRRRRASSL